MTPVETLTLVTYFFVLIILAVYGWHRYYLVYLYMSNRDKEPRALPPLDPLPVVTIQLPLYNEMYVADRLIEAVCAIDYPRELLEIQVLDDSIDETRGIAELAVRRYAAQGVDIKYYHRTDRTGYKAGALEAGLKCARGEFIGIFDADFIPTEDFLVRLMPHFNDTRSGWCRRGGATSQPDYSLLTKIQSILPRRALRSEHGGRHRAAFLQLQRDGGVGAARPSTMRAAGSTTRSPRTSTSVTAPSSGAGSSCSCPISLRRRKFRWR
jgi:cellulose synthase/poly-beta-1,6-N-acetylglucosamine synthase-like glycosyltransferase